MEALVHQGDYILTLQNDGELGRYMAVGNTEIYEGPTEVTPSDATQILETTGLVVPEDIVINPIPSKNYKLTYSGNTVGKAVLGTATTEEPFYTPSGVITLTDGNTNIKGSATLQYSISSGGYLHIVGIKLSIQPITVPTGAVFTGTGVSFDIEEETE